MTPSRFLPAAGLAALLAFACGCSNDGINHGGKLTGTVKVGDKPVTAGEVVLHGTDGKHIVSGRVRLDGTYTVVDPPLGPCKIAVRTSAYKNIPPPPAAGKKGPPVNYTDPETGEWPVYVATPARYEDQNSSQLTVEVKPGDQSHPIQLDEK